MRIIVVAVPLCCWQYLLSQRVLYSVQIYLKLVGFKYLPLLVLAASLAITYHLWNSVQLDSLSDLKNNFDYRAHDVTHRLDERLLSYEQVLVGVQALFSDSNKMDSGDFHSYIRALHLEHKFPGMHNVTFAKINSSTPSDKHKVVYTEQYSGRNQLDFGYEVFSDIRSQSAIAQAINTGKISVTDSLSMMAGGNGLKQFGFLMFVPVYIHGSQLDTVDERRANCIGWVAGTFIINDLMSGILGENVSDLDLEIFYGREIANNKLMYDTGYNRADKTTRQSWFKSINHINLSGYTWTLAITTLPDFEAKLDKSKSLLILQAGSGISILLALLIWELVRGRASAVKYAAELDASQAKLHAILDNSPIGIWFSGIDGRYLFVNKAFCNAFGMTEQQFLTRRPSEIFGSESTSDLEKTHQFSLNNETPQLYRETITFPDGKPHRLEITGVTLVDDTGINSGTIGIMNDITESSALQDALKKSRDELEARVKARTRDLEATANKLEQEMQARKKLEHNFLAVSEETQAQIGRELHDDLGQLLSGVAYLAGALFSRLVKIDQEASRQAETIKKIAQDAIKRTRYITHGLIPFNISSQGLKQALEQFADDVLVTSGLPCQVHWSGDNEITDFMISTNLYRITQEAINNAVKHSSAKKLFIKLSADENEIHLTIADDGVGLPDNSQDTSKGMGLLNMGAK